MRVSYCDKQCNITLFSNYQRLDKKSIPAGNPIRFQKFNAYSEHCDLRKVGQITQDFGQYIGINNLRTQPRIMCELLFYPKENPVPSLVYLLMPLFNHSDSGLDGQQMALYGLLDAV